MNMPNHFHQGDRQLSEAELHLTDAAPPESAGSRAVQPLGAVQPSGASQPRTASRSPLLIDQNMPLAGGTAFNGNTPRVSVWLWAAFAIASGAFAHTSPAAAASAHRSEKTEPGIHSWTQILGDAWNDSAETERAASHQAASTEQAPASTMRASGTARAMGAALSRQTIFTAWPAQKRNAARQTSTKTPASTRQTGFAPALLSAAMQPVRAFFTPAVWTPARSSESAGKNHVDTEKASPASWNRHSARSGFILASFQQLTRRTLLAQAERPAKAERPAQKSAAKSAVKPAPKASAVVSTRPKTSTARPTVQAVTGSVATPGASRVKVSQPDGKSWILKVATQKPAPSLGGTLMKSGAGLLPPASVNAKVASTGGATPSMLPSTPQLLAQVSASDPVGQMGKTPWRDAQGRPMRKVITVSSLKKLPPASKPLPAWMKAKAIPADPILPSMPGLNGSRIAQGPVPSLRQPARPVTNSDRLPNQLEVAVGTFVVLLTTTDLDTVAVAEPSIADVAVVNSRAVLVNGKAPGITSLVIVDRDRIRQYQVRVVAAPGTLPRDIAAQIGLPGVGVRQVRDAIVLEGEVETAEEARRAVEIAGIYSPKVINQLTVRGVPDSPAAMQTQIERAINLPNVTVQVIGDTALLRGTVERAAQAQQAETVAGAFAKRVLNLIELPPLTVEQVTESLATAGDAPGTLSSIRVRQVGDQIVLEGTAPTQARIDQALAIAGRTGLQVVNRLQLPTTETTLHETVRSAIGLPQVTVSGNAKMLVLQGVVPDTNAAVRAEQIALSFAGEVQNLLETPNPLLVNVDINIVEINRTKLRNLGVTFPGLSEVDPGFAAGQPIGGIGVGPGQGGVNLGASFGATIRALSDNGDARVLSNPRTTILSGRTAGFLVGGQIPIPTGSEDNDGDTVLSITFKDFGILVNILPVATPDGAITMRVYTDVSQIDPSIGFNYPFSETLIPGFTKRTAASELTIQTGRTIALSGLISTNVAQNIRKVPILSKIPILGSLFQSKRFQRNETELVFFITPRLLPNPLRDGQTAPVTVFSGVDNNGTPTFGTGAIQQQSTTTRRGSSDFREEKAPVAGTGSIRINSNSGGGGSSGGGG